MEPILAIAYAAFFLFLLRKNSFFHIDGIPQLWIQAGFLLKLGAGIALGLVYTYYYTDRSTADTFKYFDDSKILFDSLAQHPRDFFRMITGIGASDADLEPYYFRMTNWYETFSPFNDNRTMIRLNALFRFVSMGYYYVHVVFVCFLSYAGIIAVVKVFRREFLMLSREIFLTFLLLPSVLFWGSGLLKDSLVFFSAGFVLYFFDRYFAREGGKFLFRGIVFMIILMFTKFYIFILFIPMLTAWWCTIRFRIAPFAAFAGTFACFLLVAYLLSLAGPQTDLSLKLAAKQQAFFKLIEETSPGSAISIPALEPGFTGMMKAIPSGFITGLVRPFVQDAGPMLITLSALENTFILAWCVLCLFTWRTHELRGKILPVFCLFYTFVLFTLIGMVTPVLGAMVRYKAQALPFLCSALLLSSYRFFRSFGRKKSSRLNP